MFCIAFLLKVLREIIENTIMVCHDFCSVIQDTELGYIDTWPTWLEPSDCGMASK